MDDRKAVIIIDGIAYDTLFSTTAANAVIDKYGSIEKYADKILNTKELRENSDELVWIITLLINQPIRLHNIRHRDSLLPLLTEEEVSLMTIPRDYPEYWAAVWETIQRGLVRNVQSEVDHSKNSQDG